MKRKIIGLMAIVGISLAVTALLFGQSLLDNPFFREAQQYEKQAGEALDQGEYDLSYEYSRKAQEYSRLADEYTAKMVWKYKANGWLKKATERINYAQSISADANFPAEYGRASTDYDMAKRTFQSEQFEQSISHSENVLKNLANIRIVQKQEITPLPRYYTVRLIPQDRDALYKIARYRFIYDDMYQWRHIWEANREKLKDPENPHLIYPEQVFVIPSIDGEVREGIYDPSKDYSQALQERDRMKGKPAQ